MSPRARPRFAATGPDRWPHPNRSAKNRIAYRQLESALEYAASTYARGRLVDVGCGRKAWEPLFAAHVDEHVGVDHVPKLVDGVDRVDVIATAYEVPLPDGHADTVLLAEVLEHLEDPGRGLAECARLLKPGGHLIMTTPFYLARPRRAGLLSLRTRRAPVPARAGRPRGGRDRPALRRLGNGVAPGFLRARPHSPRAWRTRHGRGDLCASVGRRALGPGELPAQVQLEPPGSGPQARDGWSVIVVPPSMGADNASNREPVSGGACRAAARSSGGKKRNARGAAGRRP